MKKRFRMKILRLFIVLTLSVMSFVAPASALKGLLANEADIARLKRDLLEGKIQIGKTRLMHVRNEYGEASSIIDEDRRITYDYDELRLMFERKRLWKNWEYDTFRDPVYTADVEDLRFDLEAKELIGDNITFDMIRRTYGEPTESIETDEDGGASIYYYGDIKLTFENVISVRSWRGSNLGDVLKEEVLGSAPATTLVAPSEETAAENQ
jgi:hypothetical protein